VGGAGLVLPGVLESDEGECEVPEITLHIDCKDNLCWDCQFLHWLPNDEGGYPTCELWNALREDSPILRTEGAHEYAVRSDSCNPRGVTKCQDRSH
jgi:hypothetical protein